ncbi:hypothetical protein HPB51_021136 [Rhipicephalus microplus]|uniref:Uncharacterized protein n=1 Tax=Rhipicephalus microplus TaxID=6941 RepID=A0A9J6DWW5_RHIMP|nr:hypothetical protein HPB51_021136 [Rhipicephalus microplus]
MNPMAITFLLPRLRRKGPQGAALCSAVFLCSDGHFPRAFFLATSLAGSHSYGDQWEWPVLVGYRIQTSGCTMPRFNLFDPTVRSFIRRGSKRAHCAGKPNCLTISSRLFWRQYSSRGYRNMMFTEWAFPGHFCAFGQKGFRCPHTEYYPRHVVMLMEESVKTVEDDQSCLEPTTLSKELLDYLANFVKVMSKRPFFAFTWFADITHESLNNTAYADEPVRQLIEALYASGALNHTVLAFFSDHGMPKGDIRATYIGRLEDIQPFAFLVFPPWFLEKNPEAARSLRVNQHRLTTPFDLHATFVDLLDYPVRKRPRTAYGLSLLSEIPEQRTCADASIKPKWCSCNVKVDAAVPRTLARAMANRVVSDVNKLLARERRKRATFRLLRIIDVTLLQSTLADIARNTSHYLVDVLLSPGNVVLESTVRVSVGNAIKVEDISHGDGYKAQTYCVRRNQQEQYCYCHRTLGAQM